MKTMGIFLGFLLGFSLSGWSDESEELELYAFFNGMPRESYEKQARFLKNEGFAGISQVYAAEGGEKLAKRVAAFEKAGVKVLSLYLPAQREPVKKEMVQPLANRGGMIELTVQEINDEVIASIRKTAEMAAALRIKVALYPHAGFAVATMPQAMAVIARVDHPNLGVMFNLCHFLKSERAEDLEKVLAAAGDRLFAVSTCGADLNGHRWSELIQTLDKGSFPQKRLFDQLRQMDFDGPVGLQCFALKGDRKENLRNSMKAWRDLQTRGPSQ